MDSARYSRAIPPPWGTAGAPFSTSRESAAQGRTSELRSLVDSAVGAGLGLATQLYLLDAFAGVDVATEAAAVAERLERERNAETYDFSLWLLGTWHARAGNRSGAEAIRKELASRRGFG